MTAALVFLMIPVLVLLDAGRTSSAEMYYMTAMS